MYFTTDQQTLNDLNLFSRPGVASIFGIYNRTLTSGGAAILEEMFRYPLGDEALINARSTLIRDFLKTGTGFPFKAEHFAAIEEYLADTDERTMLTRQEQDLGSRLVNLVAADPQYKLTCKGINALIAVMTGLSNFISLPVVLSAVAYTENRKKISELLSAQAFIALLKENPGEKLPYAKVAEYDRLLRFKQRTAVRALLSETYRLDAYISVAKVAGEQNFAFPVALPKANKQLHIKGLWHPLLQNPVSNDIVMAADSSLVFLTGANMAGKSTFMKAFGTAMFLAHTGFPVAAQRMEFSVRDGIYTTINLPDNLSIGASHFYAEVLRIKKIAKEIAQGKSLFIIFDELFRGTNVKDAYEATIAIASSFAKRPDSQFVISTHIMEAGPVLAGQHANIRFCYLPTRMEGNRPVYTYKLESGITDDRHGMIIINNEGIVGMLENGKHKISAV